MVYKDISQLPKEVKVLPKEAQQLFLKTYNQMFVKHKDETTAFEIAWGMIKKNFKKVEGEWVAKGVSAQLFTIDLKLSEDVFVQKAEDGNYYIEGILSDILPDRDGKSFTTEALENFANQINTEGIFGGITHKEWQELKMKYSHLEKSEFIQKAKTERKGILKAIQAIYKEGKLWIKALIDKRYLNHIQKFNKMSLEALIPTQYQKDNKYLGGDILGFALDNDAINPRSNVRIV